MNANPPSGPRVGRLGPIPPIPVSPRKAELRSEVEAVSRKVLNAAEAGADVPMARVAAALVILTAATGHVPPTPAPYRDRFRQAKHRNYDLQVTAEIKFLGELAEGRYDHLYDGIEAAGGLVSLDALTGPYDQEYRAGGRLSARTV